MPVSFRSPYVTIKTNRDLLYLGAENLSYIASCWESWAKKADASLAETTDLKKISQLESRIQSYTKRAQHLHELSAQASSKPFFISSTPFRVRSNLTCFLTDPDCFKHGTLQRFTDVQFAEERDDDGPPAINSLKLVIRTDPTIARNAETIIVEPNLLTVYHTKDFEYYLTHPRFFEMVLRYRTELLTPTETGFIGRIMQALAATPGYRQEK